MADPEKAKRTISRATLAKRPRVQRPNKRKPTQSGGAEHHDTLAGTGMEQEPTR
jgi:hypothetical protein